MTADDLIARFEAAGATMLALPSRGYSTQLRTTKFDVLQSAMEAYGWQAAAVRPPMPSAAEISRMDEAFGWLTMIPETKYVLRRIVGARALVHPISGRHLFPWRRIGAMLGADHKSAQRWHGQGIELIVDGLNARRK
ncbi:DUF6362 family protein [Acidocella sp. KAb 2-4]|uniref:DUF6362 family protein n=1 Tax=Acidocella sp. KAb 2-4 TaxID=2885158 RepID=UPI001D073738|nr:DUF6362 family protein [Acidocella sp. KAb 2-4]MCB5944132.1 DUF6362 family protein [Acidocella sp. KAb 2-4]